MSALNDFQWFFFLRAFTMWKCSANEIHRIVITFYVRPCKSLNMIQRKMFKLNKHFDSLKINWEWILWMMISRETFSQSEFFEKWMLYNYIKAEQNRTTLSDLAHLFFELLNAKWGETKEKKSRRESSAENKIHFAFASHYNFWS